MRPQEECETVLLKLLASMPLLDRLEMVCISGWSRGAVYPAVERLEAGALIDSLPHASELVPPTRRYHLTAAGLNRLAGETGTTMVTLLRTRPVSSQWRRILMERLDALAVIYRVASAVSNTAHPIRFRWYRAMPMDAAIALPDGRTIAIVRQGPTSDRTAFSKRMWRLREGPRPSAVLVLASDEVRLRHARRVLTGAHSVAHSWRWRGTRKALAQALQSGAPPPARHFSTFARLSPTQVKPANGSRRVPWKEQRYRMR